MDSVIAGKYRVIKEIGSGGMGVVYKATHTTLNRQDALKILHPNLSKDPSFTQRFLREAQSMARLDHDNVIRVYDIFEHKGYHCIAMEYFEGFSLRYIIQTKKDLSINEIINIMSQATVGLAYAHARGIVHRDIKPSNIMANPSLQVKIADFGVAAAIGATGDTSLTMTGELVGSPCYMSPEQARGEKVDNRSDLYALGMVFYELVTKTSPFEGDSGIAIIGKLAYDKNELPLKFSADVPKIIEHIIRTLLHRDPRKRYPNALSLQKHLLDAASRHTTSIKNQSPAAKQPSRANQDQLRALHTSRSQPGNRITQSLVVVLIISLGVLGFVYKDKVIPQVLAFTKQVRPLDELVMSKAELKSEVELIHYHLVDHKKSSQNARNKFRGLKLSGVAKTTFDAAVVTLINGSTEFTEADGLISRNEFSKAKEALAISEAFFEEAEKQFLLAYELTAKDSSYSVVEGLVDEALLLQQETYTKKEIASSAQIRGRHDAEFIRGNFFQKKADALFKHSRELFKQVDLIKSRIEIEKAINSYTKAGDYFDQSKQGHDRKIAKSRLDKQLAQLRQLQLEVTSAKIDAEHDGAVTGAAELYSKANALFQELRSQESKINTLVDKGRNKRAIGQLKNAIELANNTKLIYLKASQDTKMSSH